MNDEMKQLILQTIQDNLRRTVSVKDDIMAKFTPWFQDLFNGGAAANAPPPPSDEGEGEAA